MELDPDQPIVRILRLKSLHQLAVVMRRNG
jgi:hypothetical protein